MRIERGGPALVKKIALAIALVFSFLYYVTFIQLRVLPDTFDAATSVWPLFFFALLGGFGCLLAGRMIDSSPQETVDWMMPFVAFCMAVEAVFGLVWPYVRPAAPLLGFFLGAHIILLFVLLGRGLGTADRALVAGFGFAGIFGLANVLVYAAEVAGAHSRFAAADVICWLAGAPMLFAAGVMVVGYRTGMIAAAPADLVEPPAPSWTAAPRLLAPLAVLIALDSFAFLSILQERLGALGSGPSTLWLTNGLYHVLVVPIALVALVRFGQATALGLSAGSFAVFFAFNALAPSTHVLFFTYSLFVCGYSVVFYSVWASIWPAGKAGRVTALGMMICGFGGSVGGIGLHLALGG